MSPPANVYFDVTATPREDHVTFAVVPTDAVTGAIVRAGVTAKVEGLRDRALASQTGMLVFVNLDDQPAGYDVEIDASAAGYFGPLTLHFPANAEDGNKRRLYAALEPRPDFPFAAGTTLVRGVVKDGPAAVEGALIACRPPGSAADFEAHSDAKGAFALALRLPPPADFDSKKKIQATIRLSKSGKQRDLVRELGRGRSHSFREAVDLGGANEPDFFTV